MSFCLASLTVAPLFLSATLAELSLTQDPDTSKTHTQKNKKQDKVSYKSVVQRK